MKMAYGKTITKQVLTCHDLCTFQFFLPGLKPRSKYLEGAWVFKFDFPGLVQYCINKT